MRIPSFTIPILFLTLCAVIPLLLASPAIAQKDTDGDGLLDLIDVRGFDPDASGTATFGEKPYSGSRRRQSTDQSVESFYLEQPQSRASRVVTSKG